MKKVFSMFLVLMMVLGLFAVCGLSAMASGDVTILFTANMSDASEEAYDEIAAIKDDYPGALLVDAGGYSSDSVDAMNDAGYDLAADGAAGDFTVISLADSSFNGGAALSADGSTVAFVSLSRPADAEDEAYYEAVQSIVDQAQSNGVSYVVGIGADADASDVAANVNGLDAILTASGSTGSAGLGEAMVAGANGGVGVLTLNDSGVSCSVEMISAFDGVSSGEPSAEIEEDTADNEEETNEEETDEEDISDDAQDEELPAAEVIEDPAADAASGTDLEEAPVSGSDAEEPEGADQSSENNGDPDSENNDDQNNDDQNNNSDNNGDNNGDNNDEKGGLPEESPAASPTATPTPTAAPTATPAIATAQFVKGNTDLVLTASAPVTKITFTYTGLVNGVATSIERNLDPVYYTTNGNTATIKASTLNSWGNGTYTFNLKQDSGETNIKVTISGTAPVTTNTTTGTTDTNTGSNNSTSNTATNNAGTQTTASVTATAAAAGSNSTTSNNAAATVTPAAVTAAAATAANSGVISSLVPGTGDTTQILPWVIGLVVLALALVVVVVILKKRQAR